MDKYLKNSKAMLPNDMLSEYINKNLMHYYIDNGEAIDKYCMNEIFNLCNSFNKLGFDINCIESYCIWSDVSYESDSTWLVEFDLSKFDIIRDRYLKKIGLIE